MERSRMYPYSSFRPEETIKNPPVAPDGEKLYWIDDKQLCRDCAVEEILESLEPVK